MDWDSGRPANKFIVCAFVAVLKASPAAYVIDQDGLVSGMSAQNVLQQLPKTKSSPSPVLASV